ncbi:DNA-directed RNA polymerase III subunit RPC9 [Candida tropicalis]
MKILTERDSFLSNYEVTQHLESLKKKYHWTFEPNEDSKYNHKRKDKKYYTACGINLEIITKNVLLCLENNASNVIQSDESFKSLMEFLNTFELMKIEKLQIINSLPRSLVVLYAIVEECEERLGEETSESIIAKINELFPIEQEEEEEEGEEGEEEEQEEDVEME